jgi:hypothetical protein
LSFDRGMLMKNTKLIVRDHDTGEIVPLSPSEQRMLRDRMKDADNPVRYIVASELIPRKRYFYYIASDNTYGLEIDQASQFKRRDVAGAVCKVLNGNRSHERHLVVKVTTRNNSIRVLRYHRER